MLTYNRWFNICWAESPLFWKGRNPPIETQRIEGRRASQQTCVRKYGGGQIGHGYLERTLFPYRQLQTGIPIIIRNGQSDTVIWNGYSKHQSHTVIRTWHHHSEPIIIWTRSFPSAVSICWKHGGRILYSKSKWMYLGNVVLMRTYAWLNKYAHM